MDLSMYVYWKPLRSMREFLTLSWPRHYHLLCSALLLTNVLDAGAQELSELDYSAVDSVAIHFDATGIADVSELSRKLTDGFQTDHECFRVLFRWVAEHISYDFSARHVEPEKVLESRAAKCSGYASLLQELCAYAFIECEIIEGYAKGYSTPVGTIAEPNHAWNAVLLSGQWWLVDVTWAAGYVEDRTFVKAYTENYYLTDPIRFQHTHRPLEKRWFLSKSTISRRRFFRMPYRYSDFYDMSLELHPRSHGILKNKLKLGLSSPAPIQVAYLRNEATGEQHFCSISSSSAGFTIELDCNDLPSGEYVLIINNGVPLLFIKE